ncbi:MAG: amidohydrolase family protein, partial [candidate division KSB1 bacterium]
MPHPLAFLRSKFSPRFALALALQLFFALSLFAQTAPTEGLRDNTPKVHALLNAKIVTSAGMVIEKGTVIVRDGVIEAVGATITPPADARVWDYAGRTIYPGLIEPYSNLGLAAPEASRTGPGGQQAPAEKRGGGQHWNPLIKAEENAADRVAIDKKDAKTLRDLGFGAALAAPAKGIFRGTSALVSLGEEAPQQGLLQPQVAQQLAFETASFDFNNPQARYPTSLLGAIALARQTFIDAQWYQEAQAAYRRNSNQTRPEENLALAAVGAALASRKPFLFEADNDKNFLRAVSLAREFNVNLWVRGSGHEYLQLEAIKRANVPLILPLDFPEAPSVDAPEDAVNVSFEDMQHWEAAASNAYWLHQAGVSFALTTNKLKKPSDFWSRVRKAIERGLPADAALASLTTVPAKWFGCENRLGSIAAGKIANLIVTDGDLFSEKTSIMDVWVDGGRYEIKKPALVDLRGKWEVTLALPNNQTETLLLDLKGTPEKLSGELAKDKTKVKLGKVSLDERRLALMFKGDSIGKSGVLRLSGLASKDEAAGEGSLADGAALSWRAKRKEPFVEKEKEKKETSASAKLELNKIFPRGSFMRNGIPMQAEVLFITNATIWTSGPQGKLENGDMLMRAGKIVQIGKGLVAPAGAVVIDANGKHVSPGLIDAHSHSAADAINEVGQAVTAEVRMGDVIDSRDVSLYRELAGGLTIAHVMHGSANPIGGQNQTLKLRWGADAEGLKFTETPPTIKFALGENVKQSNSQRPTNRYPQTRMGVEQLIRDRFRAAQDYEKEWAAFHLKKKDGLTIPPRRDLELDALVQILKGERFVHCHSYRQDEILMLVRIAEEFGFKPAAFQHVLEGYKVADAIAKLGAGASMF